MKLTEGAIMALKSGCLELDSKPLVQVLDYQKVELEPGPSTADDTERERYRLLLSDGRHCSSFVILAPHLNFRIQSGQLRKFAIIRLEELLPYQAYGGNKLILVLDISIIVGGMCVGHVLGNPTPIAGPSTSPFSMAEADIEVSSSPVAPLSPKASPPPFAASAPEVPLSPTAKPSPTVSSSRIAKPTSAVSQSHVAESAVSVSSVATPSPSFVVRQAPVVSSSPVATPSPVVRQARVVSSSPVATPSPIVRPAPVVSSSPVATPPPVVRQAPVVSSSPVATPSPVVRQAPVVSSSPVARPSVSSSPVARPSFSSSPIAGPGVSSSPVAGPSVSLSPGATSSLTISMSPFGRPSPSVSPVPVASLSPAGSSFPQESKATDELNNDNVLPHVLQLSEGVIKTLMLGGNVDFKPILQTLKCKNEANNDQYSMLVSDGKNFFVALLGSELNERVISGEFQDYDVFRMDSHVCYAKPNHKSMIVINELSILRIGSEVGGKLGKPTIAFEDPPATQPLQVIGSPTDHADPLERTTSVNQTVSPVNVSNYQHVKALSQGTLVTLLSAEELDFQPVLQILGYKKIAERYSLTISDGKHAYRCAWLCKALHSRLLAGEFATYTVVRLEKHVNNKLQGNKCVLIIFDLVVLCPGSAVKRKLGNPVLFSFASLKN